MFLNCFKNKNIKTPKTHDYTRTYWGHDYTFSPIHDGKKASMSGWGRGIVKGDYIIIKNHSLPTETTRYQVKSIRYCSDPSDMWFANVVFAPRQYRKYPDGRIEEVK